MVMVWSCIIIANQHAFDQSVCWKFTKHIDEEDENCLFIHSFVKMCGHLSCDG